MVRQATFEKGKVSREPFLRYSPLGERNPSPSTGNAQARSPGSLTLAPSELLVRLQRLFMTK